MAAGRRRGHRGRHGGAQADPAAGLDGKLGAFRAAHPGGLVLDEPDWRRAYGTNPYAGYDTTRPFLYAGEDPPHGIPPLERVVRVGDRAWPLTRLAREGTISEAGVMLTWTEG